MSNKNRAETLRTALVNADLPVLSDDFPDGVMDGIAHYLEARGWVYNYEPSRDEIEAFIKERYLVDQAEVHHTVWNDYWKEAREQLLLKASKEEYGS
jgi:hypothetical protein